MQACFALLSGRYSTQHRVLVRETADVYAKVTLPYVASMPEKRISWVYNILDGKKEQVEDWGQGAVGLG
jgi:hypothetical protein